MTDISTFALPGTLSASLVGVVPSARFGIDVMSSGSDTWRGPRSADERAAAAAAAAFAGAAAVATGLRNAAGYGNRSRGCPL